MSASTASIPPAPPRGPYETQLVLRLDHDERALVVAALRLLRSTLGREEADELAEVHALLEKIGTATPG